MTKDIEIVTNRKEILKLAGLSLYESELEEKLHLYKAQDKKGRIKWTSEDLDNYMRKLVSTKIVDNEFKATSGGKASRKKPDKDLIVQIATETNFEIMAIKHIYNEIKEQLELTSTKKDAKDFITAQVYAQIDQLDLEIANSVTEKDRQRWYELKMKAMDQLAKVENLEEKSANNTAIVHGSVNTQNNTTVDKQVVISESQAMVSLLNKLLPPKK